MIYLCIYFKASKNAEDARNNLMKKFKLSEVQAKAIVEMRLRQLTGLEQDKLRSEYKEIKKLIEDLKDILENKNRRMNICISIYLFFVWGRVG